MLGVYIHIPFCSAKCGYCDFHSLVADDNFVGNYLNGLKQEIIYCGTQLIDTKPTSLYIGGGTPTILSVTQIEELVRTVQDNFRFSPGCEFTVEANPGTVTKEKCEKLAEIGVNRISLGSQAFQDNLLKSIGRLHTVADIYHSVELFNQAGITNINLDLIHGLPNQSFKDWKLSLERAAKLHPAHISCYSLSIEEETPFKRKLDQGKLDLPPEETEIEMFEYTRSFLVARGYQHYEISNYALPGRQSRHNLTYWLNGSYIGLGSGAHGYFQGSRYSNCRDLKLYINNWHKQIPAIEYQEQIEPNQAMDEMMMMGLRLIKGVKDERFKQLYGCSYHDVYPEQIKELIARGLLESETGWLRLTQRGISLGNMVFSAFIR